MEMKISQSELTHMQLQAMLRENKFPSSQLLYLGERDGEHYYLIGGEHEVPVSAIVDVERQDDSV